jgi:hypothetical protein
VRFKKDNRLKHYEIVIMAPQQHYVTAAGTQAAAAIAAGLLDNYPTLLSEMGGTKFVAPKVLGVKEVIYEDEVGRTGPKGNKEDPK